MKRARVMEQPQDYKQMKLFNEPETQTKPSRKFISVYRVSLVKDGRVEFGSESLLGPQQAQGVLKSLIETQGQPDREQFCILMLNAKNKVIGLNIVSTGDLSSATVHPREVLKPAILANSAAMILGHNHPSGNLTPSPEDIGITERIIKASKIMGITVHEHLIISMNDDSFYSFSEHKLIQKMYDEAV
jgi:DNA repair protein RadC